MTPAPGLRHQNLSYRLCRILDPAATAAGLAPLYRLDGEHHVPHAKAEAEPHARSASSARPATLRIEEPVRAEIDLSALG